MCGLLSGRWNVNPMSRHTCLFRRKLLPNPQSGALQAISLDTPQHVSSARPAHWAIACFHSFPSSGMIRGRPHSASRLAHPSSVILQRRLPRCDNGVESPLRSFTPDSSQRGRSPPRSPVIHVMTWEERRSGRCETILGEESTSRWRGALSPPRRGALPVLAARTIRVENGVRDKQSGPRGGLIATGAWEEPGRSQSGRSSP